MNRRDIYNILRAANIDLDTKVKYSDVMKLNQKLKDFIFLNVKHLNCF
jgi:hypothetical protein